MLAQLRTRFAFWLQYRDTLHELSYRDPHMLRDMGFERTDREYLRKRARMAVEGRCE